MQIFAGSKEGSACPQEGETGLHMLRAPFWGSPSKLDYGLLRSQFIREATDPMALFEAHTENVGLGSLWPHRYIYSGVSSKQSLRCSGELSKGRNEEQ